MLKILAILLVVWLALTVLGVVIEGLFWLAIIGIVLFLGTAGYAALKRRTGREVT
jgi:LPXTG-motif cell wall-anchored protein